MSDLVDNQFIPDKHFPFVSRFLNYKGFKIHYIDEGNPAGPVVILLHGNPTWCFFYRPLILALKHKYRFIAIDYIGCGLSDHPEHDHFRAVYRVSEVEFVYQQLNLNRFSIIMHDWGGAIGTSFLQNHLDKVDKVIYFNTTLTEVESLPVMIKMSAHPFIGPFLTKYTAQFLKYLTGPGVVYPLSPWIKDGYMYPYKTVGRRTAIWDFVSDVPFYEDHPTYPEMKKLADGFQKMQSTPIKIIWGLRDPCFHQYMLRKVSGHFPNAEVVEIPDAGHLLMEDNPKVVIEEVESFLDGTVKVKREIPHTQSINGLFESFLSSSNEVPNSPAVIIPKERHGILNYSQLTFRELKARVFQYARGLTELGVLPGHRVLMLVPPGEEFLALSFAVMATGAVPCYVDPGVGRDKLFKCIKDCDPHVLIGSPKAQILRLRGKKLFPNLFLSVWATEYAPFGAISLGFLKRFSAASFDPKESPDDIAMIACTSGATGTPKGVVFTSFMIKKQLLIFKDSFGFKAGEKDLPLLPIFSIFSCAMGCTSVFPIMDPGQPLKLDPQIITKIIQDLSIDTSFGSPTLWDKISDYCVRHAEKLLSVKKVLMAGAPVSDDILNRVSRILPNGQALTPYGATECLPVTAPIGEELSSRRDIFSSNGEAGTPVGKPLDSCKVKIIKIADSVVRDISMTTDCKPFEIGEVIVQGDHISPSYLNRLDANMQGKIKDKDLFWHRIGDVGYFDDQGYLYYCGRKSHVVSVFDKLYFPDPVENIFNQHSMVKRSALITTGKNKVAVAIEPFASMMPKGLAQKERFETELRELAKSSPVTIDITDFFFFDSFPVDARHNAKIFRDQLSVQVKEKFLRDAA